MTSCYINAEEDADQVLCCNCGWRGENAETDAISDIQQRVTAGEEVPAGQCPKCGALCHLVAPPDWGNRFQLEKLRMVARVMRDALGTANDFMSGFEDDKGEGFMDLADLVEVRCAMELFDLQKVPTDKCRHLVELLATMTDPHESDDLDDELNAFAQMIDKAKAIVEGSPTPPPEPENVRRFLDLSTAHLKPVTRRMIEEHRAVSPVYDHPEGYGWLMHVPDPELIGDPDPDADPVPDDLQACIDKARELRCDYILFDCDAMELDGLALYDDDGAIIPEGFEENARLAADRIDGYDRDDLGESPDC